MAGHEAGAGGDPAPAFVRPRVTTRAARLDQADDGEAVTRMLAAYLLATEREKGADVASALPERYRREVDEPAAALAGTTVLVAEGAGEALGMVVLTASDQGRCEIKRLWTEPDARGRGVAGALVADACARAAARGDREAALTVWRWREGARRLYARLGFVEVTSWEAREELVCVTRALTPVMRRDDGPERS